MPDSFTYRVPRTFPMPPSEYKPPEHLALGPDEEPDLREYWDVIRRHTKLIAGLFIIVEILTLLVVVLVATPLYTGLSTILIESQTPQVLESNSNNDRPDREEVASFYRTQYEILKSRTLAAKVVRALRLDHNPYFTQKPSTQKPSLLSRLLSWPRSLFSSSHALSSEADRQRADILGVKAEMIDKYLAGLTIRPEFDTRLAQIAYTSPDPVLAAKITNAHIEAYIEDGYERRSHSNEAARRFLEGQLGELEKRVEKSEAAVNDYRRHRGDVTPSNVGKNEMVSDRLAAINKALVDAEEARIALQADVETIKNNDHDAVPAVVSNVLIQNLKVQLAQLQGRYANMASQYTPDYPDMVRLHAQVQEVQRREQEEISRVINGVRSKYQSALDRETEIRSQLDNEKARAMLLNDASLQDAVLSREVDASQTLYKSVLERIKLLGLSSESEVTNVSVIDTASVPLVPSSPKKKLSLVLSGFLALMAGIGMSFMLERFDSGLKSADEVQQYLRLPNLATVLRLSGARERSLLAKPVIQLPKFNTNSNGTYAEAVQRLAAGPDSDDENGTAPSPGLLTVSGEAYRAIRTSLMLSRAESPPKTVVFTSAVPGEGKTVTVANTAIAFAGMVDRILLIDADLRRASCSKLLHREPNTGLTEVLTGLCDLKDAIQPTAVKGLFFLSAGVNPPNPSELLGSRKMREVLAAVETLYDHVLIDSAPILPVSDTVVLSAMVDGVVLVASSETARKLVRDACHRMFHVSATMLGVVLNNVDADQQRYDASYYSYP
jgi:capsular exopolysaccharide synthesis family protein